MLSLSALGSVLQEIKKSFLRVLQVPVLLLLPLSLIALGMARKLQTLLSRDVSLHFKFTSVPYSWDHMN